MCFGYPLRAAVDHRAAGADRDGLLGGLAVTICGPVEQRDMRPARSTGQLRDAGQHRGQQLDGTAISGGVSAGPAGRVGAHSTTA